VHFHVLKLPSLRDPLPSPSILKAASVVLYLRFYFQYKDIHSSAITSLYCTVIFNSTPTVTCDHSVKIYHSSVLIVTCDTPQNFNNSFGIPVNYLSGCLTKHTLSLFRPLTLQSSASMSYKVTLEIPYPHATWRGREVPFILQETEFGTDIQATYVENGLEKVHLVTNYLLVAS
jgi:hypothetical protein